MEFGKHYPQKKQNSERNPDIQKQKDYFVLGQCKKLSLLTTDLSIKEVMLKFV